MFASGPAAGMELAPAVVVATAVVVDGVVGAAAAAIIATVVPDRVVGAVAGRRGPVVVAPVVAPLGAAVVGTMARGAGAALVVATLVADAVVVAAVVSDGVVGAVSRLRGPGTTGGERGNSAKHEDAAGHSGHRNAPSSWVP
jgi:hypothetical protein